MADIQEEMASVGDVDIEIPQEEVKDPEVEQPKTLAS